MFYMKNPSTRELFAYWDERRGGRLAPERGDIEPGAIRRVLGDSFILSFDRSVDHPFRLAGTRVCAIFGRELKGEPFVHLWDSADQAQIRDIITIAADEMTGVVAGAVAKCANGESTEFELLLLPLLRQEQTQVRLLGSMSPIKSPFWLGRHPVASLTLGALRHLDPRTKTTPTPRLIRGSQDCEHPRALTVYQGGRS
jgi:hypothetical protein